MSDLDPPADYNPAKEHADMINDFRSCTGVTDITEAIMHLEATHWDLLDAVSRVMPGESQKLPSERNLQREVIDEPHNNFVSNPEMVDNVNNLIEDVIVNESQTDINFSVNDEQKGNIHKFILSTKDTIRALKVLLFTHCAVPIHKQRLTGWPYPDPDEYTPLCLLGLPSSVSLTLVTDDTSPEQSPSNDVNYTEPQPGNQLVLRIYDKMSKSERKLYYNPSNTVIDVKTDVFNRTGIPVIHQEWTGWPDSLHDDFTQLQELENKDQLFLSFAPSYSFLCSDTSNNNTSTGGRKRIRAIMVDSDDSDENAGSSNAGTSNTNDFPPVVLDIETQEIDTDNVSNASDDYPTTSQIRIAPKTLLCEDYDDEVSASYAFSHAFTEKYGGLHPDFYAGSLDEAIKETCFKPAKDRKLLALYLHHDRSILTNIFCSQILCLDSVIQYLSSNFVIWGWDVTREHNRQLILQSITSSLGPLASKMISKIPVEKMPIVVIITRVRGNTEILTIINGDVSVNEFISSLIQATDIFTSQQTIECHEENERAKRELIKVEQDEAYRQSLEADRAKAEIKRKEDQEAIDEQVRIENEKREKDEKREENRKLVESQMPPEPDVGLGNTTQIRIRLPNSTLLNRRFLKEDKLKILLNFIIAKGFPMDEYKVVTSFPRNDLSDVDQDRTLEELKLYPQAMLVVERH